MTTIDNRKELFTTYKNNNLFIDAGAGAGKTQFISDKVIDLIIQGIKVERIVLITFTNKAAEEMLTRISNLLLDRISKETDSSIKDRLNTAKDNLFKLNVSTIHSFCSTLINENSFKAKVTYNAKLLEEDDEQVRRNKYFALYVKSLTKTDYSLINKFAFFPNPINEIKIKYMDLCKYLPEEDINTDVVSEEEFNNFIKKIDETYLLIMNNLSLGVNSKLEEFINAYTPLLEAIKKEGLPNDVTPSECLSISSIAHKIEVVITDFYKNKKFNTTGLSSSNKKLATEVNEKMFKCSKEDCKRMLTYKYKYINIYAKKAFDYYNNNFNRDELSNNYLIYLTYKLLIDDSSKEIKDTLANKYDTIIVDEFQDTDKYQIKFIDILSSSIAERKKKEGNISTSLVVVGDPKQSIYRFRGADINSFLNYRDHSLINKDIIRFPDNFRSNNYIIDYLNKVFKDKNFHDAYPYEAMTCNSKNFIDISSVTSPHNKLAGVYSYPFNFQKDDDPTYKEDSIRRIAKLVKYLVDNKYQIFKAINKNDTPSFKEVTYSDFLIITHSKSEINDIAKEFNILGIKTKVAGKFDLSSSEIFNAIYTFTSYALNKEENNLSSLKVYFEMYYKALDNPKEYKVEFDNFINKINIAIKDKSPYAILMYISMTLLKEIIFVSNFTSTDSNLYDSIVYEMLENLNINTNCDSIHLLNELENLMFNTPEQQISLIDTSNEVNIMNVHKSKGLEGNIVIIPDSGSENNSASIGDYNNIHYLNTKDKSPNILTGIEKEKIQERIRLEYVAASRAKSVLIFERKFDGRSSFFNDISKENKNVPPSLIDTYDFSYDNLINDHLLDSDLPNVEDVFNHFKDSKLYRNNNPTIISSNKSFKLSNLDNINKRIIDSYSPSLKENHEDIIDISSSIKINRPKNNVFGDLIHRGMELLMNDYSKDISLIVEEALNDKGDSLDITNKKIYKEYLIKVISSIKSLYDSSSILKDFEVYPEFKFTTFFKDSNELISGSMDLLLINKDYIKIIDYKSDIAGFKDVKSFEEILINRYKNQLSLYKRVINKLYSSISKVDLSIIWVEEKDDNQIAHEIKLNTK